MLQKSTFTLVIPCYNEEEAIASFLDEMSHFQGLFNEHFPETRLQIRIVDNNSSDSSVRLLRDSPALSRGDVQILNCTEQGYGAALKQGFSLAQSDYYAFADLDNTYPLKDFIQMLRLLIQEKAQMVMGARLHPSSEIEPVRWLGNRFYLGLTKLLFSARLTDTCTGMRIFTDQIKPQILKLRQPDLSFSIEMTAQALLQKWRVIEHPIFYRDRIGRSKLSVVKDGCRFLFILLKVRFFG